MSKKDFLTIYKHTTLCFYDKIEWARLSFKVFRNDKLTFRSLFIYQNIRNIISNPIRHLKHLIQCYLCSGFGYDNMPSEAASNNKLDILRLKIKVSIIFNVSKFVRKRFVINVLDETRTVGIFYIERYIKNIKNN